MKDRQKSFNIDVDRLWTSLQAALGNDFESLARQSGFITRSSSRLTGAMMCYLNTCLFEDTQGSSLNDLCVELDDRFGIEMKKQSLDERYNTHTVRFMRSIYEHAFQAYGTSLIKNSDGNHGFSQVKVLDATNLTLPGHLSAFYVGSGGNSSTSCAKIHYCIELLQGKADAFYLTDGASNDTAYWDSGQFQIAQGGLVLFDLGYWRGRQLGYIAEQGAYFLSRYRANISLYKQVVQQDKHEKIDLIQLLDRVSDIEEHQLWIGQEKIGIRLIVEPVPEQVRKARHTRLKRESCKKGRKSNTDLRKKMCGYNLWVTNAPATILPKEKTREYYRLRWQIELMFKIWKSLLKIDKIERMNIFRFECYLYGTLIAIMFSTEIFSFLQTALLHQTEKPLELSEWKAIKIIKKKSF